MNFITLIHLAAFVINDYTIKVCGSRATSHIRRNWWLKKPLSTGGQSADILEVPYTIALLHDGTPICAASIIAKRYTLTAAHCLDGVEGIDGLSVIYGTDYLLEDETEVAVLSIFKHPKYNPEKMENDLAVVKLSKPIIYSFKALPITLSSSEPETGDNALITGWGHGKYTNNYLLKENITVFEPSYCWKYYFLNTGNMICGLSSSGDSELCGGASGGAVVVGNQQFGIVTRTAHYGPADCNSIAVFTNLARYRSFIKQVTQNTVSWGHRQRNRKKIYYIRAANSVGRTKADYKTSQ